MKRRICDTNRDLARRARPSRHYCWSCDAYIVFDGQVCPRCKQKDIKVRDKYKKYGQAKDE